MSEVWITKNGFKVTEWDGEVKQNVEKKVDTILHELRSICHIETDVTLQDIFEAVEKDIQLAQLIRQYSWCDVHAFHEEARQEPTDKSNLIFLELEKQISFDKYEASENIDFSGVADDNIRYAIELTPVNNLKHLPVKLNPKTRIVDNREKYKILAESPSYFSTLDILDSIYYEISFNGSPEDREKFATDLFQMTEDVKSGKAKTVPLEEVEEKIQ